MSSSLIRMLNDKKYKDVLDFVINLILVNYGGRKAFLLEPHNTIYHEFGVDKLLSRALELGFTPLDI